MRELVPDVAHGQHGVFTVDQAAVEGTSRRQIEYRISQGVWQRVAGRALALESTAIGAAQLAVAACLTWPSAIVCLDIAAELHSIPIERRSIVLRGNREVRPVHVYVPTGRRAARGIVPHKTNLATMETTTRGSIRLTSKIRTVLDCLALLDWPAAQGVSAWAVTRKLLSQEVISGALSKNVGVVGAQQQRKLLARIASGAASAEELRLHDILRAAGFVDWEPNASVRVAGRMFCVDILFERSKLIIELDGAKYHSKERVQDDLQRHAALTSAGYQVLRFTPADLNDPFGIVSRVIGQGRG